MTDRKHDLSNLPPDMAAILERARGPVGDLARALNEHCPLDNPQVGCLIMVECNGQISLLDYNVSEEITPQLQDIADTVRSINEEAHGEPTGSLKIPL